MEPHAGVPQVVESLLNKLPDNGNAPLLVAFIAACCHPDYVANISMLARLPPEERTACLDVATEVLSGRVSNEESVAVLAALMPWLLGIAS